MAVTTITARHFVEIKTKKLVQKATWKNLGKKGISVTSPCGNPVSTVFEIKLHIYIKSREYRIEITVLSKSLRIRPKKERKNVSSQDGWH